MLLQADQLARYKKNKSKSAQSVSLPWPPVWQSEMLTIVYWRCPYELKQDTIRIINKSNWKARCKVAIDFSCDFSCG